MNKLFPVVATTLVLAAGGAGFYLTQRPGALGSSPVAATLAAADYLPAETLVLLALPDPGRTLENWRTTDLYKIWTEPQVQAFAAKPLSKIPPDSKVQKACQQLAALDPKNLFVALTKLDEGNNHPHLVGGFRFKGGKERLENALADAKKQIRDEFPSARADLIQHEGHAIETLTRPDGTELAAAYLDDWYLLSNDVALLKSTIDRAEHRAPSGSEPLSREADFLAVSKKLPAYETLIFGRLQPFLERLYALATAGGQTLDPKTLAESKKVRAIGATTSIENGKFRDTLYTYAPGLRQDNAHLQMKSLPLSSPETLFYLASVIQWPEKLDLPGNGATGSKAGAGARALMSALEARGITLESVRMAFDPEIGLQLTWPAASLYPSPLASIAVRDQAAAQKLVEQLTTTSVPGLAWVPHKDKDRTYYALSSSTLGKLEPTVTVTDKHVLLGLDAPTVREAVQRGAGGGGADVSASETYKTASGFVDKPNVSYAFLDVKGFFERAYGLVRPYAIMGAAFIPAQNLEYVDPSKLPEPEVIARHLSPSVLSQTLDPDGTKLESVGSVTFGQGGMGIGGLTGVATAVYFAENGYSQLLPGFMPGAKTPGTAPKSTNVPADESPAAPATPSPPVAPVGNTR